LGSGAATFSQGEQRVEVSVPVASQNAPDTIVVLELDQPASGLKTIPVDPSAAK
jgi:hypothetical protein